MSHKLNLKYIGSPLDRSQIPSVFIYTGYNENNVFKTIFSKQPFQNNHLKITFSKHSFQSNLFKRTFSKQPFQNNLFKTTFSKQPFQNILLKTTFSNVKRFFWKQGLVIENSVNVRVWYGVHVSVNVSEPKLNSVNKVINS